MPLSFGRLNAGALERPKRLSDQEAVTVAECELFSVPGSLGSLGIWVTTHARRLHPLAGCLIQHRTRCVIVYAIGEWPGLATAAPATQRRPCFFTRELSGPLAPPPSLLPDDTAATAPIRPLSAAPRFHKGTYFHAMSRAPTHTGMHIQSLIPTRMSPPSSMRSLRATHLPLRLHALMTSFADTLIPHRETTRTQCNEQASPPPCLCQT